MSQEIKETVKEEIRDFNTSMKIDWWGERAFALALWHKDVKLNRDKLRTPKHRENLLNSIEQMHVFALERKTALELSRSS